MIRNSNQAYLVQTFCTLNTTYLGTYGSRLNVVLALLNHSITIYLTGLDDMSEMNRRKQSATAADYEKTLSYLSQCADNLTSMFSVEVR